MGNVLNHRRRESRHNAARDAFLLAGMHGDLETMGQLVAGGASVEAPDMTARMQVQQRREAFLAGLHESEAQKISSENVSKTSRKIRKRIFKSRPTNADLNSAVVKEQPKCSLYETFASDILFDPNLVPLIFDMALEWPRERTPLHCAAAYNQNSGVEFLVEHGANLEAHDEDGFTPLLLAAKERHYTVMETLIRLGAHVDAQCNQGSTALMWASWNGSPHFVSRLLAAGANPNIQSRSGQTPLLFAAYDNQVEVVRILLEGNADPSIANQNGQTPLMNAAYHGHDEAVRLLLRAIKRKDLNQQDSNGATALMFAAWREHQRVVQLLLEAFADPDVQDQNGRTALMMTSWKGYKDLVRLLLDSRHSKAANPNIRDNDDHTALSWAATAFSLDVVQLLLQAHADPNIRDKDGRTALYALKWNEGQQDLEVVDLVSSGNSWSDSKTAEAAAQPAPPLGGCALAAATPSATPSPAFDSADEVAKSLDLEPLDENTKEQAEARCGPKPTAALGMMGPQADENDAPDALDFRGAIPCHHQHCDCNGATEGTKTDAPSDSSNTLCSMTGETFRMSG